jgi:ParB-like chromosome segregation protein Spo0J
MGSGHGEGTVMTEINEHAGSVPRRRRNARIADTSKKSWRDVLKVHPAAELFPRMSDDELHALADDIKTHGLKVPVVLVKEHGELFLLDGISRLDAMQLAGKLPIKNGKLSCNNRVDESTEPYTLAASLNGHRRHLTIEQKREIIAKLLKVMPVKSNRQIGELAKADDKTVGKVRAKLESTAEIPQLKKRVGKDNKARTAKSKKSLNPQSDPAPADPHPEADDADLPDLIRNLINPALKARIEAFARDSESYKLRDIENALHNLVRDARDLIDKLVKDEQITN